MNDPAIIYIHDKILLRDEYKVYYPPQGELAKLVGAPELIDVMRDVEAMLPDGYKVCFYRQGDSGWWLCQKTDN